MQLSNFIANHWAKRDEHIANGKTLLRDLWQYSKDNPDDVLLALVAVAVLDIEDDVDGLDDIESVYSIHEFRG